MVDLVVLMEWTTVLFVLSLLFTVAHAVEEVVAPGGPLWENFGDIVEASVPDGLGILLFSVALPLGLITLAAHGYEGNATAASLLFGARVGDTLISHWGLYLSGLSRPNPGLYTTPLYVLEAVLIAVLFPLSFWPAVAGAAFFAAVLPALWLYGRVFQR